MQYEIQEENLSHKLVRCPMYKSHRATFLISNLISHEFSDDTNVADEKEKSNIFNFTYNIFKIRILIQNEWNKSMLFVQSLTVLNANILLLPQIKIKC